MRFAALRRAASFLACERTSPPLRPASAIVIAITCSLLLAGCYFVLSASCYGYRWAGQSTGLKEVESGCPAGWHALVGAVNAPNLGLKSFAGRHTTDARTWAARFLAGRFQGKTQGRMGYLV